MTVATDDSDTPMVSPMSPSGECSDYDDFNLTRHWPGLGLLFHYGILVVVFASLESYKPSRLIALFFSGHVAVLCLATLVWEYFRDSLDTVTSLFVAQWMLATAILAFQLAKPLL